MSWVAVAVVAVGAYSAYSASEAQKNAASKASGTTKKIGQQNIDFQKEMFEYQKDVMKPYQRLGDTAARLGAPNLLQAGERGTQYTKPGELPEFEFKGIDTNDPIYQWKQKQAEESTNRALTSRGMYGSRVGINALADTNMNLMSQEADKQYERQLKEYGLDYGRTMDSYNLLHGSEMDQFNVDNLLSNQNYNQWIDKIKIGQGAANSAGNAAANTGGQVGQAYSGMNNSLVQSTLAGGQADAAMWSGVGQLPFNAMAANYYYNQTYPPAAGTTPAGNYMTSGLPAGSR